MHQRPTATLFRSPAPSVWCGSCTLRPRSLRYAPLVSPLTLRTYFAATHLQQQQTAFGSSSSSSSSAPYSSTDEVEEQYKLVIDVMKRRLLQANKEQLKLLARFPEFSDFIDDEEAIKSFRKKMMEQKEEQRMRQEMLDQKKRKKLRQLLKIPKEVKFGSKVLSPGDKIDLPPDIKAKILPEGLAGSADRDLLRFEEDTATIFRLPSYRLIRELERRKNHHFYGVDNRAIVLDGHKGCGKSTVLNQVVQWARENGWLAVWIPHVEPYVQTQELDPLVESEVMPGLWDQRLLAQQFVRSILSGSTEQYKKIGLKLRFDIPQFERKQDSTLFDLLSFGAENQRWAVECLYHFRRELNAVIEFPVLLAVDEYNRMWDATCYLDPADMARYRLRRMNAQKLTIVKLFSSHQDHALTNGTMICAHNATCSMKAYYQQFGTEDMFVVPTLSLEEFEKLCLYYKEIGFVTQPISRTTAKYLYTLTDGKPAELFKVVGALV